MNRRTFVQALGGAAAAAATNSRRSRHPPGFDTYSIRAFGWNIQLIDYAAKLKLDTLQLSSLDNYSEASSPGVEHGARRKPRHAARHGNRMRVSDFQSFGNPAARPRSRMSSRD